MSNFDFLNIPPVVIGKSRYQSNSTMTKEMVDGVFINLAEELLKQSGAADKHRFVVKVERETDHMMMITGQMVLTTGLEFRFCMTPDDFFQVRIEGPRWVGTTSIHDVPVSEIEQWVLQIQRSLPLIHAKDLIAPGYLQHLHDNTGLHIFVWQNEPVEYDEIPWGHVLPTGLIHAIAPPFDGDAFVDQAMINLGSAVQVVCENEKTVWWQFGPDKHPTYPNHRTIRDHLGMPDAYSHNLHCLTALDCVRFMQMYPQMVRQFQPKLVILYNPWKAPVGDTYGMPHKNDFDYWADFLTNLLLPPDSTLIALNRVPDNQIGSVDLVPWQIFPIKQRFQ